jgi:hypothetical protein
MHQDEKLIRIYFSKDDALNVSHLLISGQTKIDIQLDKTMNNEFVADVSQYNIGTGTILSFVFFKDIVGICDKIKLCSGYYTPACGCCRYPFEHEYEEDVSNHEILSFYINDFSYNSVIVKEAVVVPIADIKFEIVKQ